MPASMKISEQAELFTRVSEQVILSNGGEKIDIAGQPGYRIRLQTPRSQVSVPDWATNKCIFPLAKIRTKGTVVKVDGDNITVKINGGSEQVIPTGGAKVTQGGKPSTLAELKPGTAVKVTFKGCNYPFQAEKSPAIEISAM